MNKNTPDASAWKQPQLARTERVSQAAGLDKLRSTRTALKGLDAQRRATHHTLYGGESPRYGALVRRTFGRGL